MTPPAAERHDWESHWRALGRGRSLFGALASAVRKLLLSRAVRRYASRYFPAAGVFLEAGCGTSEASRRIPRQGRKLVGLDFSLVALRQARGQGTFDALVCADVRRLPFRDSALAGVWNLGVMEHFPPAEGARILRELRRALAPGTGVALLFWPPTFGLSRWVLAPFEWVRSRWTGREFRFFPDEVNRLPSPAAARTTLTEAGFEPLRVDFTARDGFNHLILVARKPRR